MTDTTNPGKKLWQDMSDAEQGAPLLAYHRGETIEAYLAKDEWREMDNPGWYDSWAYRTKPKPKREAVTLDGGYKKSMGWVFGSTHPQDVTHRITFDTVDGKPDPDSIRMMPIE